MKKTMMLFVVLSMIAFAAFAQDKGLTVESGYAAVLDSSDSFGQFGAGHVLYAQGTGIANLSMLSVQADFGAFYNFTNPTLIPGFYGDFGIFKSQGNFTAGASLYGNEEMQNFRISSVRAYVRFHF